MNFKNIMLILCLLLAVLTISSVCAADNQTDVNEEVLQQESSEITELSHDTEDEVISASQDDVLDYQEDWNPDELQEAIDSAEENSTLVLTSDCCWYSGIDDDGNEVTINKSLTINGNGHRIEAIHLDVSADNVIFKNIIFKNINYDGNGGLITCKDVSITAINCSFIGGHVNEVSCGGAVYGENCVFRKCIFENNTAGQGGAVYGRGCEFIGSEFYTNEATKIGDTSNFYGGGAVWGDTKAIRCIFEGNTAYVGGAMYGGCAVDCNFTNNRAENGDFAIGGAIYFGDKYFVQSCALNCVFTGNYAEMDGGATYGVNCIYCKFIDNTCSVGLNGNEAYGFIVSCYEGDTPMVDSSKYNVIQDIQFIVNSTYPCKYGEGLIFGVYTETHQLGDISGYFITEINVVNLKNGRHIKSYDYCKSNWTVNLAPGVYNVTLSIGQFTSDTITLNVTGPTKIQAEDLNTTYYSGEGINCHCYRYCGKSS